MFVRNTKNSRSFLAKWRTLCENERAITDIPSVDEYTFFLDHRHDQAILSLLYLKYPKGIRVLEHDKAFQYFLIHRRRTISEKSLLTTFTPLENKMNEVCFI